MSDAFDDLRGKEDAGQSGDACQFLTFTVGEEEYGVDIMTVREIKGWTDTTRLPNTPIFMRGVMNLRGLIIPIFDLRARFNLGLTEATPKHVTIVLQAGSRTVSILADTVSDILTVDPADIKPAPETAASTSSASDGVTSVDERFVTGLIALEDRMVVLLDIAALLSNVPLPQSANDSYDKTLTATHAFQE